MNAEFHIDLTAFLVGVGVYEEGYDPDPSQVVIDVSWVLAKYAANAAADIDAQDSADAVMLREISTLIRDAHNRVVDLRYPEDADEEEEAVTS